MGVSHAALPLGTTAGRAQWQRREPYVQSENTVLAELLRPSLATSLGSGVRKAPRQLPLPYPATPDTTGQAPLTRFRRHHAAGPAARQPEITAPQGPRTPLVYSAPRATPVRVAQPTRLHVASAGSVPRARRRQPGSPARSGNGALPLACRWRQTAVHALHPRGLIARAGRTAAPVYAANLVASARAPRRHPQSALKDISALRARQVEQRTCARLGRMLTRRVSRHPRALARAP